MTEPKGAGNFDSDAARSTAREREMTEPKGAGNFDSDAAPSTAREREMTEPKRTGNFDSDALSEMELAVRDDGRERTTSERWMPANGCDGLRFLCRKMTYGRGYESSERCTEHHR
jgi:hypothetical protein